LVPIIVPASNFAGLINDFWSDFKERARSKPTKAKKLPNGVVPSERKSLAKGKENQDSPNSPDRAFAATDNEYDFRKK
jgi:hypothetical protein